MAAMEMDDINGAEDLGVMESAADATGSIPLELDIANGNFIKVRSSAKRLSFMVSDAGLKDATHNGQVHGCRFPQREM